MVDMNDAWGFRLPPALLRLLDSGVWPRDPQSSMLQNLRPLVSSDRVRRFAPEESVIYLDAPPFRTISQEVAAGDAGDFWQRFGALHQIISKQSLIIGDFGLGSDSPIILDYSQDHATPPVLRLHWRTDGGTEWLAGAKNFDEFATILGLIPITTEVACQTHRAPDSNGPTT